MLEGEGAGALDLEGEGSLDSPAPGLEKRGGTAGQLEEIPPRHRKDRPRPRFVLVPNVGVGIFGEE